MTKDKLPALRVALKIFIRFVFKLAFRVSGRSVPWDIPVTSKHTDAHNLYVIFVCCLQKLIDLYINDTYNYPLVQIHSSE